MGKYEQNSFIGGMNLLSDDTRISNNQYRIGFNLRNRYDVLESVLESQEDLAAPPGIKQELVTFGNYLILFCAGLAYYRYYSDTGWRQIEGFAMSSTAPRFWTKAIPVATTNYYRVAATVLDGENASVNNPINLNVIASAGAGSLPGLLVQDNQNQPQFIFIQNNLPVCRTTQSFLQWSITFTDASNTEVEEGGDKREYVPIGNVMEWVDGTLYIASPDKNFIYRSVTGRPLDFMVNVSNLLATDSPFTQTGGGDASTVSYSVGVGGISCLRAMSNNALFVAASNANFSVSKNMTQGALQQFGEYTFIRTFLFNSTCLSDRTILDSDGDTRFIALTGVRSFNAVAQTQNEGRNSPFTSLVQSAFGGDINPIIQSDTASAAILYDDVEFYALNTIFGPAIAAFDTIPKCWTSFDVLQAKGKAIKILAKIELTIQRLYAVTTDDKVYALYIGPEKTLASFRSISMSANNLKDDRGYSIESQMEGKLQTVRAVLNKCTEDCGMTIVPYVNNRKSNSPVTKSITYEPPTIISTDPLNLPDINTQCNNLLFTLPNCEQGWKTFCTMSWTDGVLVQFIAMTKDVTPMNPLPSQNR